MATKKKASKGAATRPTFADGETGKVDRFKFYASLRMTRTIKLIRQLKNLSNPVIYSSTPDERKKMISALEQALESLKESYFRTTTEGKSEKFTF
jgi:hypothetical protein